MNRIGKILKSKTFWAGVIAAGGIVISAPAISIAVALKAGAAILAGVGVKDSFIKLDQQLPQ